MRTTRPNDPEPLVYTVRELAKILKLSERKVWDLIRKGELKAYRVRRSVRIRAADLDGFLGSNPYVQTSRIAW